MNTEKRCKKFIKSIWLFPALVVWLELVIHIAGSIGQKFYPIYIVFGISFGLILSFINGLFPLKAQQAMQTILGFAVSVFYGAEYTCNEILQSYYPFSVLGTAAENKLYQFIGIIIKVVFLSIPVYLLILAPMILLVIFRKKKGLFKIGEKRRWKASALVLLLAAVFHMLGLATVMLPNWNADVSPEYLYKNDVNYNDQVAELGLYNFIRIDVRNQIFPPQSEALDTSGLEALADFEQLPAQPVDADVTADEPEEEPIDTSPNVMDVDLKAIADSTNNKDVKWLAEYFNSVTPTNKNEYTGMFEGYNLVFVTVESMSGYVLSEKYTPTLWKMMQEGFQFNNFYTALHYTSTSNGECQNLLGLYPKNGNPISIKRTGELKTNMYFALAQQLGRQGYANWGYHNNWDLYGRMYSHSNLGYFWQFQYNGLYGEVKSNGDMQWPQRDSYMVEESVDDYAGKDVPFNVYYITVSGHTPYGWNWATRQYKEELASEGYTDATGGYLASVMEADRAVQKIVEALDASGDLDNTLFVVAPDHIPYAGVECLEEISGLEFGSSEAARAINESAINFDLYKNSLIVWSSSMEAPIPVDKVCCQVDILPTVSNLMGLEYDSRMLSGSDIMSTSEGLVVFSSKCLKSDRGFYNRFTQTFTPAEGVTMTPEEQDAYVEAMKTLVQCKLDCTSKIIENDFYNVVFGNEERIQGAISKHN